MLGKSMKDSLEKGEKEDLIEISQRYDLLFVEGKYYKEISKDGKIYWQKVDMSKVNELEEKGEAVAEKLVEHFDGRAVIREALRNLAPEDVEKIHKMLFKDKKNYKIKTREGHCIDMKIGNFILPIINDG